MPTIEDRFKLEYRIHYSPQYKSAVISVKVFLDKELFHKEEIIVEEQPARFLRHVLQDILKEWPKCQDLTLNLERQYQKTTI